MTEETRIIKTLISEIRFELEKILSLKDDMILLKGSFGDIAPGLQEFQAFFQACIFI